MSVDVKAFGKVAVLMGGWVSRIEAKHCFAPANDRPWMAGPDPRAMEGLK